MNTLPIRPPNVDVGAEKSLPEVVAEKVVSPSDVTADTLSTYHPFGVSHPPRASAIF